jgi:hypothetical protein
MNAFANWLFSVLLGWTGTLANSVWNTVVNAAGGISDFFSHFWLPIVLVMILAGTVLDYAVWFARWRPYLVWRSWLNRHLRSRHEQRAAHSLEYNEMDDRTLGTIADWVQTPQDQSPVYALDGTQQDYISHNSYTYPQQNPYMLNEQPVPYSPYPPNQSPSYDNQLLVTDEAPYDAPAGSSYFTPVQEYAQTGDAALPFNGYAQPQESLHYEDFDNPDAPWTLDDGFAETNAAQVPAPELSQGPLRNRRSLREKQRSKPLHFLSDLRQRIAQPDSEEGMLDGLPSPVNRQDAFHEAVYPQGYRYQDPNNRPGGGQGKS